MCGHDSSLLFSILLSYFSFLALLFSRRGLPFLFSFSVVRIWWGVREEDAMVMVWWKEGVVVG